MLVPVLRRITENNCLVERVFPIDGEWLVKPEDFVEPFSPLGKCRFPQNSKILPGKFKPVDFDPPKKFYYAGSLENGIHALPIMQNGATLWEGYLGVPISDGCVVLGTYESQ